MKRRDLLAAVLGASTLAPVTALGALSPTPPQGRGPFYPDRLPLDRDNDLVQVDGHPDLAQGEITDLSGRVLDATGKPLAGALVEIWQCDANGRYLHRGDRGGRPRDPGFQGYGRFETGHDGGYRFRTIKPVPYPGRAPHIHFAVRAAGHPPLVTQMYVEGAPENARDWLLTGIADPVARAALIVPFRPSPSATAALSARFDLVLSAS
ncbi:MAG: intradiol ring-cleavage dioxygenase [Bdellovibrio bacteriovorus]